MRRKARLIQVVLKIYFTLGIYIYIYINTGIASLCEIHHVLNTF